MPVALGVNGGVLGSNNLPSPGSYKGIWTPNEVARAIALGYWPTLYARAIAESASGADALIASTPAEILEAIIASDLISTTGAADPYFEYTTLLLPGNGTNGAQNNTFLDASTNNFTITRNGNTTQGTFSPFSQTGWGNYFNGSSYLSAGTTLFNYTTGNASTTTFTIEAFVYLTSYQTAANIYHSPSIISKGDVYLNLGVNGSGNLIFYHYDGTARSITGSTVIPLNTWTYVAVTVTGGTATIYVNGSSVGSGTWYGIQSAGQNTTSLIGRASTNASSLYFNGYMSNLRVSTVARTITTPTVAYTNDANTALLTAQSNRFVDNSSSPISLTVNGSPSVQAFSPFNPTSSWSAATNGGSGYFDGTGDYLTVSSNSSLAMGSGNFTIEFWFNSISAASGTTRMMSGIAVGGTFVANTWVFALNTVSQGLSFYVHNYSSSAPMLASTSTTIYQDLQWHHCAVVRNGNSWAMYIDGRLQGSAVTSSVALDGGSSSPVTVGWSGITGDTNYNGYMSNLRLVKGTAVYTAAFTPPTAPLTATQSANTNGNPSAAITGTATSLLLNFTNAGIYDATSKNDLETVGNAQISTAQSKFGGSSMAFDGSGDYLFGAVNTALNTFGTGNFTVEAWVYPTATKNNVILDTLPLNGNGARNNSLAFYINSSNKATIFTVGTAYALTGSVSLNTWTHLAFVREGTGANQTKIYINGVNDGTLTIATNDNLGGLNIGVSANIPSDTFGQFQGYIQGLRITKGYARYTANFTPPTAAFPTL